MDKEWTAIFEQLAARRDLSREQARRAFERVMDGSLPESAIGALLGAMLVKSECVDELIGAAEVLRANVVPVACPPGAIDTCGTGGDGVSTFNVSTTAAIIAAAAGATVAKHGNRSTTRVCGSTEVLTHLAINVDADVPTVERCLREVGIGYLNARMLHPTMRFVAPVRQAIPRRTIFNLLGPLTNPAGVRRQVLGVPEPALVAKMAEALDRLGTEHAWVVHGDGLCDLTITGPTLVHEVYRGHIRAFTIQPEDVGLRSAPRQALLVTSVAQSAEWVEAILSHAGDDPEPLSAARDHALLNTGAALVVAGVSENLKSGVQRARDAIVDGSAIETLRRWRGLAPVSSGRT